MPVFVRRPYRLFAAPCQLSDSIPVILLMANTKTIMLQIISSILMITLLTTGAVAQSGKLKDVAQCNGENQASAEAQIAGCTALIGSGLENAQTLTIAYNNRGNAYVNKGEYRLAIQDYMESI
ncbi:MAG TPA: tetratricopeptide repeat protein, partial [Sedimentisphaerales bacterium]